MIFGGGLAGLVVLVLWIWAILDVISSDEMLIRNLPKLAWLLLVILVPPIGAIAWLLLGRPEGAGFRPGDTRYQRPIRPLGPDDSPGFMTALEDEATRLRRWEEDLRKREEEMRKRDEGDPGIT